MVNQCLLLWFATIEIVSEFIQTEDSDNWLWFINTVIGLTFYVINIVLWTHNFQVSKIYLF